MHRAPAILLGALVVVGGAGCGGSPPPGCTQADACTRVLFLGNSYTSVNDLPLTFATLAAAGGHHVETAMLAPGGATLADHVASPDTVAQLGAQRWSFVVLQDQSQIPSVSSMRQSEMYPAARRLVRMVRASGAVPAFFEPWTHRQGWPEQGLSDYTSMQTAVDQGYSAIAAEQGAVVAEVGVAWSHLVARGFADRLWQVDGVHATSEGTYLAACVIYATLFARSPVGLGYHADVGADDASAIQTIAAQVVLGSAAS